MINILPILFFISVKAMSSIPMIQRVSGTALFHYSSLDKQSVPIVKYVQIIIEYNFHFLLS